jgi:hypothetical protein
MKHLVVFIWVYLHRPVGYWLVRVLSVQVVILSVYTLSRDSDVVLFVTARVSPGQTCLFFNSIPKRNVKILHINKGTGFQPSSATNRYHYSPSSCRSSQSSLPVPQFTPPSFQTRLWHVGNMPPRDQQGPDFLFQKGNEHQLRGLIT